MGTCPELKTRRDESDLPPRMRRLPVEHRGFRVPFFVQWFENGKPSASGTGEPDFRVINTPNYIACMKKHLCWICGEKLGQHLAFAIGPMCSINRVTSEPPSHRECALYALRTCPFMLRPRMRRNEKGKPDHMAVPGFHLDHNPGAMCLWTTRSYRPFSPQHGGKGVLLHLGEPERVEWFAEGRAARRAEVEAAFDKGLPHLRSLAVLDGPEGHAELERCIAVARKLLPLS